MNNNLRLIVFLSIKLLSCAALTASTFPPDNLKNGALEWKEGKTLTQQINELPADIEALDLLTTGAAFEIQKLPESWSILKRFHKLRRLEVGGPDFVLRKEFCELYDLPIESIYIRADLVDRQISREMPRLKHLKKLGLVVYSYQKEDLIHFEDLAKIETLEELKTPCAKVEEIAKLKDCPNLKRIELEGRDDDYAIEYAQMRQLEQICLEGGGCSAHDDNKFITKKGLAAIATLPHLKNLDLSAQRLIDDALEPLSKATALERLNLSGCPITDKAISYIKVLDNLKALDVTLTNLTDACFEELAVLKQLEELNISGSKTSSLGMKYFKGSKLERLTLSAISNANLVFIPDLPSLKYLNLKAASLTEVGAKHLAKCPSLISIHIGALPQKKEERIAILKELAKIKTLKQIKGVNSHALQTEIKAVLPKCTTGDLSPREEAMLSPMILPNNSHDSTYHFGCFR